MTVVRITYFFPTRLQLPIPYSHFELYRAFNVLQLLIPENMPIIQQGTRPLDKTANFSSSGRAISKGSIFGAGRRPIGRLGAAQGGAIMITPDRISQVASEQERERETAEHFGLDPRGASTSGTEKGWARQESARARVASSLHGISWSSDYFDGISGTRCVRDCTNASMHAHWVSRPGGAAATRVTFKFSITPRPA